MTLDNWRRRRAIAAAGFCACLLIAGCATSSTEGRQAALEGGSSGSDCFFNRGVRDYTALDDRNLIVYAAGRRAYHLVLATPSFNLDSEWSIGILDGGGFTGDGRICPFGGDRIIVDGPFVEQLSIRNIYALDDADVEALKVRFGKEEAATEELVTVTDVDIEADDKADAETDD